MWFRRLVTTFISLVALALATVLAAYFWALSAITAPGPLTRPVVAIVAPGSGLSQIARQLRQAGVIGNDMLFEFEARRTGQARQLKPGEYRFDPEVSLTQVLDKLVRHDVIARYVTVPEGLVTAEILAILERAEGLTGSVATPPGEGTLLPETYRYEWGDDRQKLVQRMATARDAALKQLWDSRKADLPIVSPDEAVVLASIVEKETGIAAERGKVAAVFINRLRKKMRLQSDPTVIYGIKPGGLDRPLTRADLDAPSPYNTYQIDRLPPGPIAHPGRDAIAAVLNPPDTADLYFVADGSGGHAFAPSLDEHNRNVARWRKLDQPVPAAVPTVAPVKPAAAKPLPKAEAPKAAPRIEPAKAEPAPKPKPVSIPAPAPKPAAPAESAPRPEAAADESTFRPRTNFPPG